MGKTYNYNGYGSMAYYTSETCGYANDKWVYDGCTTDYELSEVKYVVDAWKISQAPAASESRLISINEVASLGYEYRQTCAACAARWYKTEEVPTWLYNRNYNYWTMSSDNDSPSATWRVNADDLNYYNIYNNYGVVRPVIVLPKSALQ